MKLYTIPTMTGRRYIIDVDYCDFAIAPLDRFDRMLFRECDNGSVADKVLAIQVLAFRLEQAAAETP